MNKKDRRKDILRKKNARKYAPKIVKKYRKPIFAPTNEKDKDGNLLLDERGAPLVKKVGHKMVKRKINKFTYADAKSLNLKNIERRIKMNKFLAYYSLAITSLGAILCIFDGTEDGFLGGIMFIPIVYFLFTLVIDIAKSEDEDNV